MFGHFMFGWRLLEFFFHLLYSIELGIICKRGALEMAMLSAVCVSLVKYNPKQSYNSVHKSILFLQLIKLKYVCNKCVLRTQTTKCQAICVP